MNILRCECDFFFSLRHISLPCVYNSSCVLVVGWFCCYKIAKRLSHHYTVQLCNPCVSFLNQYLCITVRYGREDLLASCQAIYKSRLTQRTNIDVWDAHKTRSNEKRWDAKMTEGRECRRKQFDDDRPDEQQTSNTTRGKKKHPGIFTTSNMSGALLTHTSHTHRTG